MRTGAPDYAEPIVGWRGWFVVASAEVEAAASFVRGRDSLREAIGAVTGRVSLWGKVVECERGWRAERAYPARLYVPLGRHGRLSLLSRPTADAERLALALRAYGVPVELVACASVRKLARLLEREHREG